MPDDAESSRSKLHPAPPALKQPPGDTKIDPGNSPTKPEASPPYKTNQPTDQPNRSEVIE